MSYSQLVPGNTGMTARGRAVLWAQTAGERPVQEMGSTLPGVPARVGYTSSSTPSLMASSWSTGTASPARKMVAEEVVRPTSTPPGAGPSHSARMAPHMPV